MAQVLVDEEQLEALIHSRLQKILAENKRDYPLAKLGAEPQWVWDANKSNTHTIPSALLDDGYTTGAQPLSLDWNSILSNYGLRLKSIENAFGGGFMEIPAEAPGITISIPGFVGGTSGFSCNTTGEDPGGSASPEISNVFPEANQVRVAFKEPTDSPYFGIVYTYKI